MIIDELNYIQKKFNMISIVFTYSDNNYIIWLSELILYKIYVAAHKKKWLTCCAVTTN